VRIRILYVASFRDAAGREEEAREVPHGIRVRHLWDAIAGDVPHFARFPAIPPVAVNREYASAETELHDGDEVAFLPPVAGGGCS
jgi:molybdopterin converting factor subunit 1